MTCLKMKKQLVKLSVLVGLLMVGVLLFAGPVSAEDPLQFKIEITPDTLTAPTTVRVSISVLNMSDDGTPISVTLSDPDGKVCSSFGSGGTANLAPGSSTAYAGSWTVTQAQLEAGKIIYSARYSITNAAGQPVSANHPITKSIKYNQATAKLDVSRTISPGTTVTEGQTVTISYKLTNNGTVDISNISIADPGIISEPVKYPLLKAGESADLSYHFTAETSSKTTNGEVTYSHLVGSKTETKTGKCDAQVINVTTPEVAVKLTVSQSTVKAGDKVQLICTITNKSKLDYEQLKITDLIQGDIDSGRSVAAGKSIEVKKEVEVKQASTYQFTIKGIDSSGGAVTFESNSVTVKTSDDASASTASAIPPDLDIAIEADRDIIYSQPSDIVFNVKVTNFGTAEVKNVVIAAASQVAQRSKDIRTIEKIAPGETVEFTQSFSASMGGKFIFTATAKDSAGAAVKKESNPVQVTFTATMPPVTPPPTATIPPTEPPPPVDQPSAEATAPFGTGEGQSMGAGTILLYALAGLLFIILLAVVLLFVLDRRRNSGSASSGGGSVAVIDSIQRSPHRDYARAPKRAPSAGRREPKPGKKGKEESAVSAYAPEDRDSFDDDGLNPLSPSAASTPKDSYDDAVDVYRRPVTVRSDVKQFDSDDDKTSGAADDSYSGEYLSRIRGGSKKADEEIELPEMEEEDKPADIGPLSTMSDEDAALLSGSTGQYRLSRSSNLSVPGGRTPPKVEDPDAFTRKQRASRTTGRGAPSSDLSNFYDDDEDDEDQPKAARHRRR